MICLCRPMALTIARHYTPPWSWADTHCSVCSLGDLFYSFLCYAVGFFLRLLQVCIILKSVPGSALYLHTCAWQAGMYILFGSSNISSHNKAYIRGSPACDWFCCRTRIPPVGKAGTVCRPSRSAFHVWDAKYQTRVAWEYTLSARRERKVWYDNCRMNSKT